MKYSILILFLLAACSNEPLPPCSAKSDNQAVMDTALKALMVTQGYWIDENCI